MVLKEAADASIGVRGKAELQLSQTVRNKLPVTAIKDGARISVEISAVHTQSKPLGRSKTIKTIGEPALELDQVRQVVPEPPVFRHPLGAFLVVSSDPTRTDKQLPRSISTRCGLQTPVMPDTCLT